MDGLEKPPFAGDGKITKGDKLGFELAQIFPEWSSTRISRWLGVNPRTVQRWLKVGRGEFVDETIPDDVASKIRTTAAHIENIDLGDQLDRWMTMQLSAKPKGNGVDKEILAAYMAHRYKRLTGRDID